MAGLFDFGLGNGNWFTWLGQPSPGQPGQPPGQPMQLTGTTPPQGTPPTGTPPSPYTPQMVNQARYQLLAQMGMGLMAAGQPMTGAQRSQYLAQLGQLPGDYQKSLADQLEMAQKQQAYQRQQQQQAYLSSLGPEQLQKLGFTPEQATLFKGLGAPASIIEQKAFAQPGDPNTQVVEAGGHKLLIDQRTGNTVKDLGPVTPDPSLTLQQKGQQFTQEHQLSGDYVTAAKPFRDTQTAYQHMQAAAKVSDPKYKPQSDIAMVFGFMKMLDPTSTVREGEQASARDAGGVPATVVNMYNSLVGGGSLTEDQRAGMMEQANQAYQQQLQSYQQTREQYRTTAQSYGLDPDRVAPDLTYGVQVPPSQQPQSSQAPPPVGTVKNGYQFKGGNPADPNSWQKVQ